MEEKIIHIEFITQRQQIQLWHACQKLKKTTFIKSANWVRKSKPLECYSVYWMMILENGCHILTRMFLAKHNLIQINDYSFPLDKCGRKFIFHFFYRLFFFFFLEQLWVYSKMEQKAQRFPIGPLPPPSHIHSLPIISIPHQSTTFVKTDEPTLAHHYGPESSVYISVHAWRCTLCGFGLM